MEKESLIQGLRTRIGEDDAKIISDKTFDGVATEVLSMFADDTKVTDDTWKLPVALLKQFAGQKRFDDKNFAQKFESDFKTQHEKDVEARIQQAVEKAVEDYKKAHPEQTPPATPPAEDLDSKVAEAVANAIKGITGADSEFGKLSASMSAFLKGQQEREKTALLEGIKTQLQTHLLAKEKAVYQDGNVPQELQNLIEDTVKYLDYGENPTFDGLKDAVVAAYEKEFKRRYPNGGQPFAGFQSGGGGGGEDNFVKSRIKQLQKEAEDADNYAKTMEASFS